MRVPRCLNFFTYIDCQYCGHWYEHTVTFPNWDVLSWISFLNRAIVSERKACPAETHTMSPRQLEHLSLRVCVCVRLSVCVVQTNVPEPSAPLSICWSPPGWTKVTTLLSFTAYVDLCAHISAHSACVWLRGGGNCTYWRKRATSDHTKGISN